MDEYRSDKQPASSRPVLAATQVDKTTLAAPVIPGQPSPEVPPREEWPSSAGSLKKAPARGLWDPGIVRPAVVESFRKLDPRHMWHNPVMFVVEVGAIITSIILIGN